MQRPPQGLNEEMLRNAVMASPRLAGFLNGNVESGTPPEKSPASLKQQKSGVEHRPPPIDSGKLPPVNTVEEFTFTPQEAPQPLESLGFVEPEEKNLVLDREEPAITGEAQELPELDRVDDKVEVGVPVQADVQQDALLGPVPPVNSLPPQPAPVVEPIALPEVAATAEPIQNEAPIENEKRDFIIDDHGFSRGLVRHGTSNLAWGLAALAALILLMVTLIVTWPSIGPMLGFSAKTAPQPNTGVVASGQVAPTPAIQYSTDAASAVSPASSVAALPESAVAPAPVSAPQSTQ